MKTAKAYETICIYGMPGVGKTSQITELVQLVKARLGADKIVRLASANADGWGVIQPSVDLGDVVPMWVPAFPWTIQVVDRLTKGWWPENPEDPASKMLPPAQQKDWAKVGAVVFDSGTDYADIIMRYMLNREAQPRSTFRGAAEGASHVYKDGAPAEGSTPGDETGYAAAGRGHFGSDQNRLEQFINQSKDIPDRFVMWTFLADKGKDTVTRTAVYGPDVIGSAINGKVPSWFGRTIHMTVDPQTKKRVMWLHNHYDAGDPVPYLANVRDHWQAPLADFLANEDARLTVLYKKLDESFAKVKARTQAQGAPK